MIILRPPDSRRTLVITYVPHKCHKSSMRDKKSFFDCQPRVLRIWANCHALACSVIFQTTALWFINKTVRFCQKNSSDDAKIGPIACSEVTEEERNAIFPHLFWPILAIFDQFFPLISYTVRHTWYMFTQGRAIDSVYAERMNTGSDAVKTERQTKWARKPFFPWIWVLVYFLIPKKCFLRDSLSMQINQLPKYLYL